MSSRAFQVRRDAGTCPLCEQGFRRGEMALYATARLGRDGRLARLTREDEEEVKGAVRRAFRRARAAGERGRGSEPLDLDWVWERMAHEQCAQAEGLIDGGRGVVVARRGTRTTGWNDRTGGAPVARAQAVPAPAPLPEAVRPVAASLEAAGVEVRGLQVASISRPPRRMREQAPQAPAPVAPAPTGLEQVAHVVERFRGLELDPDPDLAGEAKGALEALLDGTLPPARKFDPQDWQ